MRQYPINIIEVGINKVIIATPVLSERIDRLCGGIKIAAIKALTLRVRCSGEAIDREWTPFGVDCPEYVRMQTPIGVIDIARQSVSAFIGTRDIQSAVASIFRRRHSIHMSFTSPDSASTGPPPLFRLYTDASESNVNVTLLPDSLSDRHGVRSAYSTASSSR